MATMTVSADPSTRRLSEVARHVVVPEGIVDTLWFEVERQCAGWGDEFDTWQDGLGQLILGLRADGSFAATIGGVTLSIPRQVAKTFIVGRIVFALCVLFPNLTVLWTAHRTRTASQTFNKLKGLAQKSGVRPYMAAGGGIRSANGEQEFSFRNGSKILFGAREQGFGRGFDEVDIEVFDEAQILTEKALEDMVAATNQSRFQFGALLFFMGTPPRPTDPGTEFANRRREALEVKSEGQVYAEHGDSMYVECSADPNVGKAGGPSLDDIKQVEIANPSYPHRTPLVSIKRLRKQLTSEGSWRREGLGVWDDFEGSRNVFGAGQWGGCGTDEPPTVPPGALAVAVTMDLTRSSIGAAALDDGLVQVKPLQHGPGTGWVVEAAKDLQDRWDVDVVIDSRGPGAVLIPHLERAGVRLRIAKTPDVLDACAGIHSLVADELLRHGNYPELNNAVDHAEKRSVGDRWAWGRKASTDDISPLEAVTLAAWAVTEPTDEPTTSAYEDSGLEVV